MFLETSDHSVRVLMISPQYRPILGGYERAAERLSLALTDRGHSVCVLAERRDPAWPRQEYLGGVTLLRWWCLYRPHLHILSSVIGLVAKLLSIGRRYDVWHVHQYGVHAMVTVICGKLIGRPVVMKLTSSSYQGLSMMVAKSRMPRLMAATLRRLDAVVALTRETEMEAIDFGIPVSRIHCFGNGVDTAIFVPPTSVDKTNIKKTLGLNCLGGLVLFVGRLDEAKNPLGLLHAWKESLGELNDYWKLVLIGDGPARFSVQSFIMDHNLSDQVLLAGQRDDIELWMKAADIFVLPSRREGLSNALLEAMACGLPVVATRVSGVTELVEEAGAGLVVIIDDMTEFSRAIVRLARDTDLRITMGTQARRAVKSRYSINNVAANHEALYHHLLLATSK